MSEQQKNALLPPDDCGAGTGTDPRLELDNVKIARGAARVWIDAIVPRSEENGAPFFRKKYLAGAVINLREAGHTYREIASKLGVSRQFVLLTLDKHKPELRERRSRALQSLAVGLRADGYAYDEIAAELEFSTSAVRKVIRSAGADLPRTNPRDLGLTDPEIIGSPWFQSAARRLYPEATLKYVNRYRELAGYADRGFSVAEAAAAMGVSYSTAHRWARSYGVNLRRLRTARSLGARQELSGG